MIPELPRRLQVCELLTKNAWRQVKELLKSASPTNKVGHAVLGSLDCPAARPLQGCHVASRRCACRLTK